MKIFKLIWRFFRYLPAQHNPLSKAFLLLPFLIMSVFIFSLMAYQRSNDGEIIEFLSYSPVPSPIGKLYSLAHYSAINGDLELGRYFYELSGEYLTASNSTSNDLYKIIYPGENLKLRAIEISKWLIIYPTSRDLNIEQARIAREMNDKELWQSSIATLKKVDPNNEAVLGLIDL